MKLINGDKLEKHLDYLIQKEEQLAKECSQSPNNEFERQRRYCFEADALAYGLCKNVMNYYLVADTQVMSQCMPVVHCKDCKHRKEHHYEETGEKPYIKYECKFTKYSMSDDGFCSFGVRMDGDKDNNVRNLTDEETAIYENWIESEAKDTGENIMEGDTNG